MYLYFNLYFNFPSYDVSVFQLSIMWCFCILTFHRMMYLYFNFPPYVFGFSTLCIYVSRNFLVACMLFSIIIVHL